MLPTLIRSVGRPQRARWAAASVCGLVTGRATYEGTKQYVQESGIELFHKLEKANLLITPIIHGPPLTVIHGPDDDANVAIIQALLYNKSNAVYVYNHYSRGAWYSAQVAKLVENGLPREGVVCIADLGYAAEREVLAERLFEATKLSDLGHIDFAIIRANEYNLNVDERSMGADILNESIAFLESVCSQDVLTAYGIRLEISPYNLHTPIFEKVEPIFECAGAAPTMEISLNQNDCPMEKCDALLYETAPTTAYPASYTVLKADPNDIKSNPEIFENTDFEATRVHTRIAVNPLTCYEGWGDGPETLKHIKNRRRNNVDEYLISRGYDRSSFLMFSGPPGQPSYHSKRIEDKVRGALITLCPKLKTSKTLQEQALRLVFSVGNDVCVLDSDLSAAMGKFNLTLKDVLSVKDTEYVFGRFRLIPELFEGQSN